ncbi:MAG: hypothetical protein L0271_09995, partial [Gemmatimonadetes bacterium]|nr:hypothetical protein [Gemmatimonadota bacterium]
MQCAGEGDAAGCGAISGRRSSSAVRVTALFALISASISFLLFGALGIRIFLWSLPLVPLVWMLSGFATGWGVRPVVVILALLASLYVAGVASLERRFPAIVIPCRPLTAVSGAQG